MSPALGEEGGQISGYGPDGGHSGRVVHVGRPYGANEGDGFRVVRLALRLGFGFGFAYGIVPRRFARRSAAPIATADHGSMQ